MGSRYKALMDMINSPDEENLTLVEEIIKNLKLNISYDEIIS